MIVHFCEEDRFYLIAELPTGVRYTAQAGGIACRHPEVEGAVVCASQADIDDVADEMCEMGCFAKPMTLQRVALANELLGRLCWGTFSQVENLRIDDARLSECIEGWWRVTFDLVYGLYPKSRSSHSGVVCGPNCD